MVVLSGSQLFGCPPNSRLLYKVLLDEMENIDLKKRFWKTVTVSLKKSNQNKRYVGDTATRPKRINVNWMIRQMISSVN